MTGRTLLLASIILFVTSPVNADIATADSARARGDYQAAIAEYQRLAQAGDDVAQATLGYMIYVGEGIAQDYEQAVNWYRQAAQQGNADAQYNLAVAYAFGEGVGQNFSEAVRWYTLAAEQNHAVAQYSLGLSHAYGEGAEQDPENAAYWFSRAAENGYLRAQVLLASKYHTGDGVPLDYEEAARWYRAAAEQGDAIAQFNLGSMYRLGTGVSRDANEALIWYRLSSAQGYAAATDELANLERALDAQRASLQMSTEISMTAEAAVLDEMVELPAPEDDGIAGIINESEIHTTEINNMPANESSPEYESQGEPASLEQLPVAAASVEDYTDLMNMENLDPSLPDENSVIAGQLLSDDPVTEEMEESESAITAMETAEPDETAQESGGFFSRLFSRTRNQVATESEPGIPVQGDEDDITPETTDSEVLDTGEVQAGQAQPETEQIANADGQAQESRGFFSRLLSGPSRQDNNDPGESPESPETGQLAMAEQGSIIKVPLEQVPEMNFRSINSLYEQGLSKLAEKNYGEAVGLFRSAAAQGDPMAQYQLGTLYYQGLGLNQNYSEAALWYRRAAEQGNVDAQYSIGNMSLMGEGIPQNDLQAQYWYKEAAKQGHLSAIHNLDNLDRFSQNNDLVTEDISKEIQEIDISLSMNIEQAMANETIEVEQQATENLVATLEPAVRSDVPSSLAMVDYERGLAYSFGEGVSKNLETAFEYFKIAAEKNYAPAQYKLAVAYAYAEGTDQDKSQAVYWYQKAAFQGHTISQRNLGVMYENGDGIEQDKELALAWYSILAESGNVMDIRRMETLSSELSFDEVEAANRKKNDLLAEISVNRM
jgi:uncharacterized protein